ncbi:MAG: hypothetical protein DRP59_07055 [Spirochaetes bacterium]|nr:MAG: hypothetical protein DRP59_07055 [Spirochaetota bacterium]
MIQKLTNRLSIVTRGYLKLTTGIVKAVLILAAAAGINIILIYPLWYSAIHYSTLYTAVTGTAIIAAILFFTVKFILRKAASEKAKGKSPVLFLIRPLVRTSAAVAVVFCLYLFSILFFRGYRIAALTGLLIFLFAAGLIFFSKKNN